MSACCDPSGCRRMFDARHAERNARDFRKKGLDATGERLVRSVARRGLTEARVLEIGGGVGGLAIELLRAGAARAVNVEISPEYEGAALGLARDLGFEGRIERVIGDAAEVVPALGPFDVVVMHRVVCCYADADRLMSVAARASQRLLALTFPRPTPIVRLGLAVGNLWFRIIRNGFRVFAHSPGTILGAVAREGLRPVEDFEGFFWRGVVLERGT